ncbi:uncharacterized protein K452DRAFT_42594 [Aplosporella prunicola CBS 121167]|uniref:Uncharacterized protein n=1 Tax=Aplosporella prunicola CBS 121167 TaxID=1176127 RepID=A0A6A6B9F1_9PEZI|nr:uncharacterized protein K452DRAFT_42594 [Aplosporella prunicola CBS 121167]KAF2140902.1 hypothetical protein K452DRAFT_42594 [Aplosporella prunicola CBS 121167]
MRGLADGRCCRRCRLASSRHQRASPHGPYSRSPDPISNQRPQPLAHPPPPLLLHPPSPPLSAATHPSAQQRSSERAVHSTPHPRAPDFSGFSPIRQN